MAAGPPEGGGSSAIGADELARAVREGYAIRGPGRHVDGSLLARAMSRLHPGDRLELAGVEIRPGLSLISAQVHGNVVVRDCTFLGSVELAGSSLRSLDLRGSEFTGTLDLSRIRVEGDLVLGDTLGRHYRLVDVHIGGVLDLGNARCRGISLDGARVGGRCVLTGLRQPSSNGSSTSAVPVPVSMEDAHLFAGDGAITAPRPPTPATPSGGQSGWDLALEVLGLGAALAAWVAVVGGARVWAQLHAAGVPGAPTITGVGRELMVVEGLQVLTLPLIVGIVIALGAYYFHEELADWSLKAGQAPRVALLAAGLAVISLFLTFQLLDDIGRLERWQKALLVLALTVVAIGTAWWMHARQGAKVFVTGATTTVLFVLTASLGSGLLTVQLRWLVGIVVVTALVLVLTWRALEGKAPAGIALTMFVAVALWSGTVTILQEAGARTPPQAWARITFNDGSRVEGRLLGRTGERIYLAWPLDSGEGTPKSRVAVFENAAVAKFVYAENKLPWTDGHPKPTRTGNSLGQQIAATVTGLRGLTRSTGQPATEPPTPDTPDTPEDQPGNAEPPDVVRPAQPPEPQDDEPVAFLTRSVRDQMIHYGVLSLVRRGGLLELELGIVNQSGEPWTIGTSLSDSGEPAADGLVLIDGDDQFEYHVAVAGGHCACSDRLDEVTLEHGDRYYVSALFTAPPRTTKAMDLRIPGIGLIHRVPVS